MREAGRDDGVTDAGPADGGGLPPSPGSWPPVSVVMPVLNEAAHLRTAVQRILDQDYPGEVEVVLAVGPSRDATHEIAAELAAATPAVRVVDNPTGATPRGLNAAIAASRHPVVVRVDGHALLSPGYLRRGVTLLEQTGADNVGGIMAAEGETAFEQAVACAMRSTLGVGAARFHTGGDAGPADTVYLGVFRRSSLERAGGYDPAYLRAQDAELNHRIRAGGGLVWFDPSLQVSYRPRSTLRALATQYLNYGRWRRVVMRQHPDSVRLRYLAPPVLVVGLATAAVGAVLVHPLALAVPTGYVAALVAGAVVTGRGLPAASLVRLPVIFATMHVSWGWGFLTSPRRLGHDRGGAGVEGSPLDGPEESGAATVDGGPASSRRPAR